MQYYRKLFSSSLKSVFLRVFTPKSAGGDVNPSLEPNVPTSQYKPILTGKESQSDWTYSVKDVPIKDAQTVLGLAEFNKDLSTMFYIHGYRECSDSQSVRTVVNAYLTRADYNIIVVDWRGIAHKNLLSAALTTSALGGELAEAIGKMVKCGLPLDSVHVVAHSMGAHVASFLCKYTICPIPRFTALDPSGVGFNWMGIDGLRLCPDDACFVDVIHTDGGRYGLYYSVGHADFYPNNGRRIQPGCPKSYSFTNPFSADAMASHWRSWQFYAESVTCGRDQFLSRAACSWSEFKENKPTCDCSPMGFYADCAARGDFFCQTNATPPFGRGIKGTHYETNLEKAMEDKGKPKPKPKSGPKKSEGKNAEKNEVKPCAPIPSKSESKCQKPSNTKDKKTAAGKCSKKPAPSKKPAKKRPTPKKKKPKDGCSPP